MHNDKECEKEKDKMRRELELYAKICNYWKTKFICDFQKEDLDIQEHLANFFRTGSL